MKIKTKLFLNVAMVAGISITISATSYVGMTFIKDKLSFLTEKSTPFQIKTLELQRSSQAAAADLVKVSVAKSKAELAGYKSDFAGSLEAVKKVQDSLEGMSSEKYSVYSDLQESYDSLTDTVSKSISSNEEASQANKVMSQQLAGAINSLKALDSKVKALQSKSTTTYASSVEDRDAMSERTASMAMVKTHLRDVMIVILQSQKGGTDKYRTQTKTVFARIQQNSNVRNIPRIQEEVKKLAAKAEDYYSAKASDPAKADTLIAEIQKGMDGLIEMFDDELDTVSGKFAEATGKQGKNFAQSSAAVNALSINAELVASGLSLDGLIVRIANANSKAEVDSLLSQISTQYNKISKASNALEQTLKKANATSEVKYLHQAVGSLSSVYNSTTSQEGFAAKIKTSIDLRDKAISESGKLRDIVIALAEKGKKTEASAQGEQEKSIAAVNSMIRKSLGLILTIGLLAVAFGLGFGYWMYRGISIPLSHLMDTAREIASGNLRCEVSSEGTDEIGQVQAEMSRMVGSLQDIAKKIGMATDIMASNSEELSSTSRILEQSTDAQTSRIEQSAVAMAEMSQTTNAISDNANSTAATASAMKATAGQGRAKMHSAVKELHQFADTIKSSSAEVEMLGAQSEKIHGMVELINDIADQTNLLALNAAIEAARAGEHGLGFAVVADEVRKLSSRTAEATAEIKGNVASMAAGVEKTIKLIKDENTSVDKVVTIVNQSVTSIDEMVENMDRITEMIDQIAVAAHQQSATSDDISNMMNSIAEVAKEIKTAFVDVKNSSQSLATTASDLNDTTKWFRI